MPHLVKINQYWTLAANLEFLEGSACTITEAYGLLKNMQFDDDPCAVKNYIKKRLSNSDLETIINCTNLTIDPTSYALLQKIQPTSATVERSFIMLSKLLRKDKNFDVKNVEKYMMLYQGRSQKKIEGGQIFATFNVTSFTYNGILPFVNYGRRYYKNCCTKLRKCECDFTGSNVVLSKTALIVQLQL